MNRNADPGFDFRIAEWLEADPNIAPADLMRTVDSALSSIPQRRVVRLPWRLPPMTTFARLAIAAAVVLAIGTLGIVALRPGGMPAVGSQPTASPSPSASASPSPTPSNPPPLSGSFTSPRNGIALAYPAGWATTAATSAWTTNLWPSFGAPEGDFMYDPSLTSDLFIAVSSQPVADTAADRWAADVLAADDGCTATESVTIDGVTGVAGTENCNRAAVVSDGRGYLVVLYTSGDHPWLADAYGGAWFRQLLSTIDLRPAEAVS